MRPVQIPDSHDDYPEAALKAILYQTRIDGQMVVDEVSVMASNLKTLIDLWSNNDFGTVVDAGGQRLKLLSLDPATNLTMNEKFNALASVVTIDKDYGQARSTLIGGLGAFCSYCELPVSANLAVEHRLPKAYFPTLFLDWSNFLLACPICNSTKGDRPNQHIGDDYYSTDTAQGMLQDLYAWPQAYWGAYTQATDLLPFEYRLCELNRGRNVWEYGDVIMGDGLDRLMNRYEAGMGSVNDNAYGMAQNPGVSSPNRAGFSYIAVKVVARSNQAHPGLSDALRRMIDVTGLNTCPNPAASANTDFRVALRTQAYLRATSLHRQLGRLFEMGVNPSNLQGMARDAMTSTGFWGIWQTVFKDTPDIVRQSINQAFPHTLAKLWLI